LAEMTESGICKGWERVEQSDCCPECDEVNGEQYSLDDDWEDIHPNCRGTCLPIVG
jgi:hypothetical protein